MNDIEGKAVRETATERGREGVSITKDETVAIGHPVPFAHLVLVRRTTRDARSHLLRR